MPLPKFKTFGRRKSGGNIIDEESPTTTTPPTGFRVIPRDEANRRSVGGPRAVLSQPDYPPGRQNSYEDDAKSSNRGSNSTGASSHSRIFEVANTRLSSSSTLQSPLETAKKESYFPARSQSPAYLNLPQDMEFQDEFGDLFSGLDKRSSFLNDAKLISTPPAPAVLRSESEPMLAKFPGVTRTPSPFALAKVGNTQDSPHSYTGRTSRDGLISDVPPVPPPHLSKFDPRTLLRKPVMMERTTSIESFSRSGAEEDADAQMVKESFKAHRASVLPNARINTLKQNGSSEASSSSTNSINTPSISSTSNSSLDHITPTIRIGQTNEPTPTPRSRTMPIDEEDEPLFGISDSSKSDALLALNLSESRNSSSKDDEPKKVYTAAQFKLLKRHEMSNDSPDEVETNGDNYDDDEDDEVAQAQKRRLQEHKDAQHKIWRQRMSKAIGDQSTNVSRAYAGFHSTPNLFSKSGKAPGSDGDSSSDEDIPLAVLQAHGFPSKNRPPDARNSANSFVGVTRPGSTIGQIARPGSPGGSRSVAGRPQSSLPPFARKLPQDPYFGASDLVTPANRESMGFNSQRPQSVYTPAGAPPPPNMPNGLVGVIAEEERSRSMRRGSPNQPGLRQSTYMPPMGPGMAMPMMPMPVGGPEQQMFNQQMVQLLQQQTMMIQHLMTQNGGQGMQQAPSVVGMPPAQPRPLSMAAGSVRLNARTMSMVNVAPPIQPRTMSMVNLQPNMGPAFGMDTFSTGFRPNYAPSVAPSERSNIGQPSRYKPVQSSTFADGGSTITAVNTAQPSEKKKSFLSAIIHPSYKSKNNAPSDEDEDDDWSKFAAKRRGKA